MSINPMRSNVYHPATQARQPLPKFGGGTKKLTPQEMTHVKNANVFQTGILGTDSANWDTSDNWNLYENAMHGLRDTFTNKLQYPDAHQTGLITIEERHQKVVEKQLKDQEKLMASINSAQADAFESTQSAESTQEAKQTGKVKATAQTANESTEGDTPAPAENPEKPTWTSKEERTKTKVLMDVTSHYFTRGKVVSDLLWSVGIGAVCAIGSPVMAVTIPTTMAVFGGLRLLQLAAKWFKNPKGDDIDKMYQKWIEADEAKAKKAEGKSS